MQNSRSKRNEMKSNRLGRIEGHRRREVTLATGFFLLFVVRCKSQASFIELSEELKLEPEEQPDELLMLLIVPVDNYTTNKWRRGG